MGLRQVGAVLGVSNGSAPGDGAVNIDTSEGRSYPGARILRPTAVLLGARCDRHRAGSAVDGDSDDDRLGNGLLFCTVVWLLRGLNPHADMAVASQGCRALSYCRRHSERTILNQIIQQHLETYRTLAREDDWDGERVPAADSNSRQVPAYGSREFRNDLEYGILAHDFARARCADFGHDFFVAFSCKGRGRDHHRHREQVRRRVLRLLRPQRPA